jgi:hypothetical protein
MEAICYYAYWASTELARERGRYSTYKGSLWDQGILPLDTLNLLEKSRGGYIEVDRSATLDWEALRRKIATDGMRNSNCVAIAPTATISNIVSVLTLPSNLALATCRSSPICLVSSPSSIPIWCVTSNVWACGTMSWSWTSNTLTVRCARLTAFRKTSKTCMPLHSRLKHSGWLRQLRAAKNGSTKRSHSISTWRVPLAKTRRDLQTRLAARTQNHLLPAHHQCHANRKIHRTSRLTQLGVFRFTHRRTECTRSCCDGCASTTAERSGRYRREVLRR